MTVSEYLADRWGVLLALGVQHGLVTIYSVTTAAAISLAVAVAARRVPWIAASTVAVAATLLTVPSLALFGLLIPLLGLGAAPTLVAMTIYAVLPILQNTIAGFQSISSKLLDAAEGTGMSRAQCLWKVELPIAWPFAMAGIRVSTVMILAISTTAAAVNGPGLGSLIFRGLARLGGANALNDVVAATVGVVVLAVIFDSMLVMLKIATTKRGVRG